MREKLEFERLDDAVTYIKSLIDNGYQKTGEWNLAQCCEHLNYWITYPLDGFPNPGLFMGIMMWLMKLTIGKKQLNSILKDGFKDGIPTVPLTVVKPDSIDDQAAFKKLRASVQRFNNHQGAIVSSPLFGDMTKEIVTKLQLRHFEHHLRFLISKAV